MRIQMGKVKLTHEQFVEKAKLLNEKVEVIGQYINSTTPVLVRCKICDHQFYSRPAVILSGHGCAKCFGGIKIDHEVFLQRIENSGLPVTVLGKYEGNNKKIAVQCNICNYIWMPAAGSLLQGHGCPKCAGKARISHEEFIERFEKLNSSITVLGQFTRMSKPVLVRCNKCGYEWEANPKNLLHGSGCIVCAKKKKKTNASFNEELMCVAPEIDVLGEYIDANTKIRVRCKLCGYQWKSSPHNLLRGYGCPICVLAGTSRVERFILECFCEIFGKENVLSRDTQYIGAELDIFVPSKKFAIEYGAWYWHKNKLENDVLKRKLCHEKGVRLITIYDAFDDSIAPFEQDCYVFPQALSINSMKSLAMLIEDLLHDAGESLTNEIDFLKIKELVIRTSGNNKHQDFVNIITAINPDVEIIGKYISANTPIETKCKKCGYVWGPIPTNLKNGSGCPKCKRKTKKTNEEFVKELFEVHNNIEPLAPYINAHTKIGFRCKNCGYVWNTTPNKILRGLGCPNCRSNHL